MSRAGKVFEKGACIDYDVIITSEFNLRATFYKYMLPTIVAFRGKS